MAVVFDKYKLYDRSVQDPEHDIDFVNEEFQEIRGKKPLSLREDFCGTAYLSCEWVKQGRRHKAVAVDLDPEVIEYSKKKRWAKLSPSQQRRVRYIKQNVLRNPGIKTDVVVAFNFSYWVFLRRKELLCYFRAVRRSIKRGGIFLIDTKGGGEVVEPRIERKKFRGFTYYWECETFNPVTNECHYAIHFKPDGSRIRKRVFTYHWRYWTVPETREILQDAGFSKTIVYWEGDDAKGRGNGIFKPVETAENCLIWIAHIIALP